MKNMKRMIAKQLSKMVEPKASKTDKITPFKWLAGSVTIPNDKK
ncbi:hypothetical protein [Paenibacillus lycopersici]|nr:hypothetical protein [Paenibacillus lycopersici]